jgi:hypothetical protein
VGLRWGLLDHAEVIFSRRGPARERNNLLIYRRVRGPVRPAG